MIMFYTVIDTLNTLFANVCFQLYLLGVWDNLHLHLVGPVTDICFACVLSKCLCFILHCLWRVKTMLKLFFSLSKPFLTVLVENAVNID